MLSWNIQWKNLKLNVCKFWNRTGKTNSKGNVLFIQGKLNGSFCFVWKRNTLQTKRLCSESWWWWLPYFQYLGHMQTQGL